MQGNEYMSEQDTIHNMVTAKIKSVRAAIDRLKKQQSDMSRLPETLRGGDSRPLTGQIAALLDILSTLETQEKAFHKADKADDIDDIVSLCTFLTRVEVRQAEMIRRNGLARLCVEKERERLSATHRFEDDGYDQCFLTPDTVITENEKNTAEENLD